MNKAKLLLSTALLVSSATLLHATVIETITIDLSPINPSSLLTGSVTLANPIPLDGSASIALSFTDPADYTAASLGTTLSVALGTIGDTVRFSPLTFTNVANHSTIDLMVDAPAQCATGPSDPSGVPCQATGLWQDQDPAKFTGKYFITAVNVPEPGSGLLVVFLGVGFALVRRLIPRGYFF